MYNLMDWAREICKADFSIALKGSPTTLRNGIPNSFCSCCRVIFFFSSAWGQKYETFSAFQLANRETFSGSFGNFRAKLALLILLTPGRPILQFFKWRVICTGQSGERLQDKRVRSFFQFLNRFQRFLSLFKAPIKMITIDLKICIFFIKYDAF